MSFDKDNSNGPLHDANFYASWYLSEDNRFRYQPQTPSDDIPLLLDDVAFLKEADALIAKRRTSGISGDKFIYSCMSATERARFATALRKRYRPLPIFPAADESEMDRMIRRIEDEFGKAFLRVSVPSKPSVDYRRPGEEQHLYSDAHRFPKQVLQHYQQASEPAPSSQYWPVQSRQMVETPRASYSNYSLMMDRREPTKQYESYYSTAHATPVSPNKGGMRGESFESAASTDRSSGILRMQQILPVSILKKESRLNRQEPIAEVFEMLPADSHSKDIHDLAKNQSSTRIAVMKEIEATSQMLDAAESISDQVTYSSHIAMLKVKLNDLMTTGNDRAAASSTNILEIDQLLAPFSRESLQQKTLEVDRIIPDFVAKQRGRSLSPNNPSRRKGSRSRSRSKKSKTRHDKLIGVHESSPSTMQPSRPQTFERGKGDRYEYRGESFEDEAITKREIQIPNAINVHNDYDGPSSDFPSRVRIMAPSNLPAGYELDAELDGRLLKVKAPEKGAYKGEVFVADTHNTLDNKRQHEAVGSSWKGGLFDCLAYGMDHPVFCHSFFCPQVALAQIMTRMRLSAYGNRVASSRSRLKIKTVLLLSFAFALLNVLLVTIMVRNPNVAATVFCASIFCLFNLPTIFVFFQVVVHTRRAIRSTFNIPEQNCEGCEDLLVSIWCTSCAISQMMKHTADYDTYRAVWFSESGLPNHVDAFPSPVAPRTPVT